MKPYAEPLGNLMLSYARMCSALIELLEPELGSEAAAFELLEKGMRDIGKRCRRLFRERLNHHQTKILHCALQRIKPLIDYRNHIVHGEWWFDPFDGGRLRIRRVRNGQISELADISPAKLTSWAKELEIAADELEDVSESLRFQREGIGQS